MNLECAMNCGPHGIDPRSKKKRLMKHKKTKSIHAAIGDVAARISYGWSWGRDDKQEQEYAKMICQAVGVKVRKCPLPKNLQGAPLSSQNR